MKNFFCLILVSFIIQFVSAQEGSIVSKDLIYDISGIDVRPEFPGGMNKFYEFIGENYITPTIKGLSGKIYVSFIIEKDGSLTDIKVLRDLKHGTGLEAIRVLQLSPKWIPGEQNGKKVRCFFSMPIAIIAK